MTDLLTPDSRAEVLAAEFSAVLDSFTLQAGSGVPERVQRALYLAACLQSRANALQTPSERRQQAELDRMVSMPRDKATLVMMTDQAFRARSARRAVDQLQHVLDAQGIPRFFSSLDRTLLKGFKSFGAYLPGVAMPLVEQNMRNETANVILPAEDDLLAQHLRNRNAANLRMNVNFLGEALLGEEEAASRMTRYIAALRKPEIEVISVKISTIFSQISSLARTHTVDVISDRLVKLYQEAASNTFVRPDGSQVPKFVYLDMEEYRDMDITVAAFISALESPGLQSLEAGIALQAYIPDAWQAQQSLMRWARSRVAAGGAPITLRLVKGANMEMERLEASLMGWPQASFKTKRETDANFKRMLDAALHADNAHALRIGIASHNLFEVAYGLILALERQALDRVQLEMLEGMANGQRRALTELFDEMLLYAPASRREDFIYAIGYLIRRLDENTGTENFLAHAFRLVPGSEDWQRLAEGFVESCDLAASVQGSARRTQDRNLEPEIPAMGANWQEFGNEPDTDFSLAANRRWAESLWQRWRERCDDAAPDIPLVIAGQERLRPSQLLECEDPSRPGVVVGRYLRANDEDIEEALECAHHDPDGWRKLTPHARFEILGQVAQEIRRARSDLMGAALADGGKTLYESDPEVSEAVDFVEFYRRSAHGYFGRTDVAARPLGTVVVVAPWNFPIAIPCGGVSAALSAGNTVILKPASDTVLVAFELCKAFWRAGVPRSALQFLPCSGRQSGTRLVGDSRVDAVILTGGTDTARSILAAHPRVNLLAETGGKNATIVTAMADREQAIKHILHSAFSHAGQKCSATSLLVLEPEVYDDPDFRRALSDAVVSMPVGTAWDPVTRVGPLMHPPAGALAHAIDDLEPGESWAVAPEVDPHNPRLVHPSVKWGVVPGSFTHMTELFGPVLAVMRADNLAHAMDIVNQTGYGLTSAIETLDDREQDIWEQGILAGNLYVNRPTTGAIVLRQPFGGMGKSAFGPGIKAGGPNYVVQFMHFEDRSQAAVWTAPGPSPADALLADLHLRLAELDIDESGVPGVEREQVLQAISSYEQAWDKEFSHGHDSFRLIGQDNIRRYNPVGSMRIRVHGNDSFFEIFARVCAARQAGCRITVSADAAAHSPAVRLLETLTSSWAGAIEFVRESDAQLIDVIRHGGTERVRYASPDRVPLAVCETVADTGIFLASAPVLACGRIELLWYMREQSTCNDYHRYGNLGARSAEPRADVL